MRLSLLPATERPRERLLEKGAEALSDAELLALLLRTGSRGKNAVELAQDLLTEHGSLQRIFGLSLSQLCRTHGIGVSKAVQFKACLELAKRLLSYPGSAVDLQTVLENIRAETAFAKTEMLFAIYLDARRRVLKVERIGAGTVDACVFHPRELFKTAFAENAAAIALAHNHPTGDSNPSVADFELTHALSGLCSSLGLRWSGHFILGRDGVQKMV